MTRDDALAATREALLAAEAQAAHLRMLASRVSGRADPVALDDFARVEQLHAFLRMFEQLHDVIARRLFRGAITLIEEDATALSAKALTLRLDQLDAIPDGRAWARIGEVRSMLVHDYPVSAVIFTQHVLAAEASLDGLLAALRHIAAFLRKEGLFS